MHYHGISTIIIWAELGLVLLAGAYLLITLLIGAVRHWGLIGSLQNVSLMALAILIWPVAVLLFLILWLVPPIRNLLNAYYIWKYILNPFTRVAEDYSRSKRGLPLSKVS